MAKNPQTGSSDVYYILNPEMANLIKSMRKKLGLSQSELADMANTTGLIISRIETLRTTKIKEDLLLKLEELFHLSPGAISDLESISYKTIESAPPFMQNHSNSTNKNASISHSKASYCRICGIKLFEDSIFCHNCGTKVL